MIEREQRAERLRAAAGTFGEEVLEAVLWESVEEALLALRPGPGIDAWAEGLEAWGRDLLSRWPDEVAAFVEAFKEDEESGRLDRVRSRLRDAARRPMGRVPSVSSSSASTWPRITGRIGSVDLEPTEPLTEQVLVARLREMTAPA